MINLILFFEILAGPAHKKFNRDDTFCGMCVTSNKKKADLDK